ncbi:uncharacterized protein [Littorina saxatilis]|uniref:Uncharacterized protein n=1 Tax=Littorina saxatilis TaxID=31220 RepID=A0AAN9BWB1_9CAEN
MTWMMILGSLLCGIGGFAPMWIVSDTTALVDRVVQGWVGLLEYCVFSDVFNTVKCWHHDIWEICLCCILFCCLPGLISVICYICCCDPPTKLLGVISILAGLLGAAVVAMFVQNTEKLVGPVLGLKLTSYGVSLYAFCCGAAILMLAGMDALKSEPAEINGNAEEEEPERYLE